VCFFTLSKPSAERRRAEAIGAAMSNRLTALEDFQPYFHLPLTQAAKELGVCGTQLKNLCRKINLVNWPYRKIQSLQKAAAAVEKQCREICRKKSSAGGPPCVHKKRVAEIEELIEKVKENPNEAKELTHTSSSTPAVGGTGETARSDLSKDAFIRMLQQRSASTKSTKRKREEVYVPSTPLPTLSEFLEEMSENSYQQNSSSAAAGAAASAVSAVGAQSTSNAWAASQVSNSENGGAPPRVVVVKNILNKGWTFSDQERSTDDGGLEYPGSVEVEVVTEDDHMGRFQRRKFVGPVFLPPLELQSGTNNETIVLEPRILGPQHERLSFSPWVTRLSNNM